MIDFGDHIPEKRALDLTPMIDVVFLLLIFFLLTSIFSKPSIPLNLPQAESAKISREPEVSVAIRLDGSVLLNNKSISLAELQSALTVLYEGKQRKEISLISDKGVPFGRVVEVMDLAKNAGAEDIAVVADKKK